MVCLVLLLCLSPAFVFYLIVGFLGTTVRFGKVEHGKEIRFHIARDLIHSDYLFESDLWKDLFIPKGRYIKIGWGDRKIFLETKSWGDLTAEAFLTAFFGLNKTVLKIEFMEEVPANSKPMEISQRQFGVVKEHVRSSFRGEPIKRKPSHCQTGEYYESDLTYNCVTNCNNWVNYGLYLAKATNRMWCPFSFLI